MNIQTAHNKIKEYFLSKENIKSVEDVIELPNKYGDNVSSFTLKYNYEDEFNYTVRDFNIYWDKKVLFIRLENYFPFKTYKDIINTVNEYLK